MKSIIDRIKREPLVLSAFISAVILLAVNFGLQITDTQTSSILNVIATFGVLLGASGVARQSTVPLQDVITYQDAEGVKTEGPALETI